MKLHYEQSGNGPTTLLLIHGFPFDHSMWDAQRTALSTDYRVVTPDLRGLGKSLLDPCSRQTTMAEAADDLAELLDQLGVEKCVYGGLSMGGYIGWEFWNRHADRLEKLVICDTNAGCDTPEGVEARRQMADRVEQEKSVVSLTSAMPKLLAPVTIAEKHEVVTHYRRMVEGNTPQGVAAFARGMAERSDFTSRLAEIDKPALVLCGALDALSPPDSMKTLATRMPNARFVEIPAAGHLAPMENPTQVNRAIQEFCR